MFKAEIDKSFDIFMIMYKELMAAIESIALYVSLVTVQPVKPNTCNVSIIRTELLNTGGSWDLMKVK